MSKFIKTKCGSLVNVDTISSIQKRKTNINDDLVLIKYIIKNNQKQEFIYNSSLFWISTEHGEDYIYQVDFCKAIIDEIANFMENINDFVLFSNIKANSKGKPIIDISQLKRLR